MVLYPLAYVLVFSVANPLIFRWYLAPPLPFYFLGILVGLQAIIMDVARRFDRERTGTWIVGVATSVLLVFSLGAYTLHPDHGPDRPAPQMAWYKLELLYQQAAESLKPRLQPGDVVAAGDIGAVGWFTGAPILDTVGLISPEATPYYPLDPSLLVINYAMSPDLIREAQPDYIVTLEVYVRQSVLPESWFGDQYDLLEELETDIYGSDGMLVFERVE
jgi:hypothetical protein